jgi:carboxyl-terminal processing protease
MSFYLASLLVAAVACSHAALAGEPSPAPTSSASKVPPDLARRIGEITDAVLQHHIDPPVRQQMILGGVKALYQASGLPAPIGLSRRISAVTTPDELAVLLAEVWPKPPAKPLLPPILEEAMFNGLLGSVPGGAHLMSAKERKVAEQLEGNRYVGIQIALAMDDSEKLTRIAEVFEGGPAERAGAKTNDLIVKIDDTDVKGMSVTEVVNRLRGDEGTDVTITVRQPKSNESRVLKMTRVALARVTVQGLRKRTAGGWDVRLDGNDAVGYLRITEISASTPHELRNLARQLENEGVRSVVLDLRGTAGNSVQPTVLFADSLLDHGTIGRVRGVEREMTYEADSDALFRGWPMAVLIDGNTWGTAEWLAAALQDTHRATLVGSPTRGASGTPTGDVRSRVALGDGASSITLMTGYLERADGRPLSTVSSQLLMVDPSIVPVRNKAAQKVDTGVKPDHAVTTNPNDKKVFRGRGALPFSDVHDEWSDTALQKAVVVLRESQRKA